MYRIKKKRNHWYVSGQVKGVRVRRKFDLALPKEEIERLVEQMTLQALTHGLGCHTKTLNDAVALYERGRGAIPKSTVYTLRQIEKDLGGTRLLSVNAGDLNSYALRKWGHLKPGARRRYITTLQAVVNNAAEYGWCHKVSLRRPADSPERQRFLSEDEQEALLLWSPEYVWPLFLFALMTGARIGELVALTWSDIVERPDGSKHVTLASRKGKGVRRVRTVPLNRRAEEALIEQARLNGQGPVPLWRRKGAVFRKLDGRKWGSAASVASVFRQTVERAGLEDVRPHDLRRTFASTLMMRGVSMRTIAELLGHSDLGMVSRYAHLAPGAKEAAVLHL